MRNHVLLFCSIIGLGIAFSAHAVWEPFWEVRFSDSLDIGGQVYTDTYAVGTGNDDGYDMTEDILKLYIPHGGALGPRPYVAMSSTVAGGIELCRDARPEAMGVKNWDIDKKIGGSLTGTETISWTLSNVSPAMTVKLIDYGADATRGSSVAIIDLKSQGSYNFAVTGVSGTYRYMRFQAIIVEDTDDDGLADDWELGYWGNLSHTAGGDDDIGGGDGYSNYDEYIAGSDPTDSGSYFEIYRITKDDSDSVTLYWRDSSMLRLYSLLYNDTGFDVNDWAVVPNRGSFLGREGSDLWTDNGTEIISPTITSTARRSYKVGVSVPGPTEGKKLLIFGGNSLDTIYLKREASALEEIYPAIDGVIIPVYRDGWEGPRHGMIGPWFGSVAYSNEDFDEAIARLQTTNFEKFTDNFLYLRTVMGAGSGGENLSWFDPNWSQIANNGAVAAYVCREAGLKGIMIDVEGYPGSGPYPYPFDYDPYSGSYTLEEVQAQVRQRGREFMEAITAVYPDITIIMIPCAQQELNWGGPYDGLLTPFADGILEGLSDQARLIDGGENHYYFKNYESFVAYKNQAKNLGLAKTALPELYQEKVTYAFGVWDEGYDPWYTENPANFYLNYRSPEVLEHSLYNALTASDEYVWIYVWHPQVHWHPDLTLGGQAQTQCDNCPHSQMPQEYIDAINNSRRFHDLNWIAP